MSLPTCDVQDRKQWLKDRAKYGGKDGLSKKHSMSKALDKFHAAIAKADKTSDATAAIEACEALETTVKGYRDDVAKAGDYTSLLGYLKGNLGENLRLYKIKLQNLTDGDQDYSQDVENALRIGERWKTIAQEAQVKLRQKKFEIDEIGQWWERIETAIKKGETQNTQTAEEFEGRVTLERRNLARLDKEARKLFEDFNAWALDGPRKGFTTINAELKLGDVQRNRGAAVALACRGLLTEVAKVISQVDDIWYKEMKPGLDPLLDQGEKLQKLLEGAISLVEAERERVVKATVEFGNLVDKVLHASLDVQGSVSLYAEIRPLKAFKPELADTYAKRIEVVKKRQASLPQLTEGLRRKVREIKEDLPEELNASPEVKKLDKMLADAELRLKQTGTLYTKILETMGGLGYTV